MNVQRFTAANSRDAMRKVRAQLGEDALIIGNRATETGIEILAAMDPAAATAVAPEPPAEAPVPSAVLARPPGEVVADAVTADGWSERLFDELREVKAMLASVAAVGGETSLRHRDRLRDLLRGASFSEEICAEISRNLPPVWNVTDWNSEAIRPWLLRQLEHHLPAATDGAAMVDAGGVFALVGPTGSGKTTTTAKIAAHYVMRHGADNLALVSTDSYRVGAHEHLREYANLLNVQFCALNQGDSLPGILAGLAAKKVVLVDTVGLSQRDTRVLEQFSQLQSAHERLTFVLLLNGSSHQETLEEVVGCYRRAASAAGGRIDHCILTKLDEACSPVPVVDKAATHGLSPIYTTSGQRVPEDIEPPDLPGLLDPVVLRLLQPQAPVKSEAGTAPADWTRELLSRGRQISVALKMLDASVPGFGQLEALWDVSLLPPTWQASRLDQILQDTPRIGGPGDTGAILWSDNASVKNDAFYCPTLLLDAALQPTALTSLERLRKGDEATALAAAEGLHGIRTHLLASLPGRSCLNWLQQHERNWVAPVRGTKCVSIAGESLSLADINRETSDLVRHTLPFRGQPALLDVTRTPVAFSAGSERSAETEFSGVAWLGTLRSAHTGMVISQRYWLSAAGLSCASALCRQLSLNSFSAQTRRIWTTLGTVPGFQSSQELRMLVASGLAAIALHIDIAEADASHELKQQLQAIVGGKRSLNANSLLDALCHLFIARELIVPGRAN